MNPADEAFTLLLARKMHDMYHEGATLEDALEEWLQRVYLYNHVQRRDNWRHRLYAWYARKCIERNAWGPAHCGTGHEVVICRAG